MRDDDTLSGKHNRVAPESVNDVRPDDGSTPREKPSETGQTGPASARADQGSLPTDVLWDDRFEHGYDKLMEHDRERARYRAIGQIVASLSAHTSLLDVGCGIGTMADYLPELAYTGVDISQKALAIARERHTGTFICSNAESFHINRKFDVILFNETLYYLEDPLEQLVRYGEFLSDEGSLIVSIWLPGPDHPRKALHFQLIDEIITSDVFAQYPMQTCDIGETELQWKVIRIGMSG